MSSPLVELFLLKSAVITGELRSVMTRENVSSARGALEAQADSLVTDYLRQVDFSTVADAERMSEFYRLFYILENEIRDLIEGTMESGRGEDWWDQHVPQVVRDNAKKNWDREAAEGLPPRSDRFLDYTTFGDYALCDTKGRDTARHMKSLPPLISPRPSASSGRRLAA